MTSLQSQLQSERVVTGAGVKEEDASVSEAIAVEAKGLEKRIDDRPVLRGINLRINAGRYAVLLGANGAGKTTLLRVLATLIPPTQGHLHIFGRSLRAEPVAVRAGIGLIGHQSMLYRDLSARENLEFFGKLYDLPDPRGRALELLEFVNLADRADDQVKTFSRGMTQRVAIARALMHKPKLLLADEPFAGLDAPSSRLLERMLAGLHRDGMTIILANHDIEQSLRLSEHAIVLRRGSVVIDEPADEVNADRVLKEVEAR